MNTLLGEGHHGATRYPLGRLFDEVNLVTERVNNQMVVEAQLIQAAVAGMLSKGARGQFSKLTKQLNVSTKLRPGLYDEALGSPYED